MKIDPTSLYGDFETYVSEGEIKEFMRSQGLTPPEIPGEDRPEVPDDVADLPHKVVGELLTKLTAWHSYVSHKAMVAENLAEAMKDMYDDAYGQVYLVKAGTAQERKFLTDLDPKVRAYKQACSRTKKEARTLANDLANLDREIKTVSRAITLLEAESRIQSRDYNVGRRTSARIKGEE